MNEYERLRRQAIVLRDMYPPGTRVAINKTVPTVSGNSVLVAFGDSSKQDVITGLAAPDPVPSVFKLQTSAGHLKIVKTAEDGNISGIEFTVTGTNFNKTAKTDAKGELVLWDMIIILLDTVLFAQRN